MQITKPAQRHRAPLTSVRAAWYLFPMMSIIQSQISIIGAQLRRFFAYRANIWSGALYGALRLAMRAALWMALFRGADAGSSFGETMSFFILCDVFVSAYAERASDLIGQDIRSGDIALRLTSPVAYQMYLGAMQLSGWLKRLLPQGATILLGGLIFIGLTPPAGVWALAGFAASMVLASAIYLLVDLCIGYSAFYLTDYWYLKWFNEALFALFGGLALPLWFYPDWLLRLAGALPFQYAVYQPIAIYLGRVPASEIIQSLLMQCFWIGVLLALERLIWRAAMRRLCVQGG